MLTIYPSDSTRQIKVNFNPKNFLASFIFFAGGNPSGFAEGATSGPVFFKIQPIFYFSVSKGNIFNDNARFPGPKLLKHRVFNINSEFFKSLTAEIKIISFFFYCVFLFIDPLYRFTRKRAPTKPYKVSVGITPTPLFFKFYCFFCFCP